MRSDRLQRQIDRLLDQAEAAVDRSDWALARDRAENVLALDPENPDAQAFLAAAERALLRVGSNGTGLPAAHEAPTAPAIPAPAEPTSFVNRRYEVRRFLGEGGKKLVYLAHDTQLDRDVAFALIKTEGLDQVARERVSREAQAMGRLGSHPHIVTVFDLGEEAGQPYMVTELMGGGDVEGVIEKAEDGKLPVDRVLRIAEQVCQGLEFAHGKGIVHRDLKPGNVWLTGDGVAKIGDFGLAVAIDRTRLTQAGMMVGTVSYMPPEQATGGEITPRSDLYSLGAMLYEMVTGRPPFVGDEAVAIIGQHLNTPPVAPSWHVPDLPVGLETLILKLLEKDPGKRPASAAEVRAALAAVDLSPIPSPARGGEPVAGTESGTGVAASLPSLEGKGAGGLGPSPLYRRAFVGREAELRQLHAAFDAALSGQGGLVMVVGEPGIGKTSVCEQLATYVTLRGGKPLIGHCYEEGSLSLPYLPFVEAMRSYVLAREPDGLKADLGSGAADVARIISEVRDRVTVELRPAGDPEDDRWRLYQAITGFLRNASSVQPLFILLEDLHDADRGTLDLLVHLSRNLEGVRLLIVGTYRDVEVDRAHPLSATLAELRRIASFSRVPLRGLTVDEVHRMMTMIRGQEAPWARAEAIHRQTEGNPLFIQEVLRYLVEEGLVVREGGRYVRTDSGDPDAGIPEGLRDVIGKRLSRLGEKTNQVLSMAAVIGRDFRLDVLQRVANLPEEEVEGALEEASERAVIETRPGIGGVLTFRFTHAFFRQTLYEEIFAARRIRWHQQVARALEDVHARRLEEHAAELAEHFAHSSDPADLAKAVGYAELAARRAMSVYAYAEAVGHWQQALNAQDVLDPDARERRCDLLLALADAMLPLEEPGRIASSVAEEAFTLAEALADRRRAVRAAVAALDGLARGDSRGRTFARPEFQGWVTRLDRHAQAGSRERVYADLYQGMALIGGTTILAGAGTATLLMGAVSRALELDEKALVFAAAGYALAYSGALQEREAVERLALQIRDRPRDGATARDLGICLYHVGIVLLQGGDRTGAETIWRELSELVARTHDASLVVSAMSLPAYLAFIDGRIEDAIAVCESVEARAQELGVTPRLDVNRLLFDVGRGTEQALKAYEGSIGLAQGARAVILSYLGRTAEAQAIREGFLSDIGAHEGIGNGPLLRNLLETAMLGGDESATRTLAHRLAPLAGRLAIGSAYQFSGSVARYLGAAAAMVGNPNEARAYYDQALEVCGRVRFRPEIALTRLQIAELLLEHYPDERVAAIEHLDFAIGELRDMKMQPSLERALRHRELLKA